MNVMRFDIDDFSEVIEENAATKSKVGKHSKIYSILRGIMSKDVSDHHALSDEEMDAIVYVNENDDTLDSEVYGLIDNNAILKDLYAPIMIDRIVKTVEKVPYYPDTRIDKQNRKDIFDKSEHKFFRDVLSGIKSEDHPLYAIYSPLNGSDMLDRIVIYAPSDANLNWIDVSQVINFGYLFHGSSFNGDISLWHLDNAENVYMMFDDSDFNGDISKWRFPKIESTSNMFSNSRFNGDISGWQFPKVRSMSSMFYGSHFHGDISGWEFPRVRNMSNMFANMECCDIKMDGWKFPEVYSMRDMFKGSVVKSDISGWQFPKVGDMSHMFDHASIETDISQWKFPQVVEMYGMFEYAQMSGVDISKWQFPKLRNMSEMFYGSHFDGDISDWTVPKNCVTNHMFRNADISDAHIPIQLLKRKPQTWQR